MNPLSIAASAVTFLSVSNSTRKIYYDLWRETKEAESSLLGKNYGWQVATLITTCFPETATQYEQIDAKVLHGGDEETLAFRQAITDESNMTAVAVRPRPIST